MQLINYYRFGDQTAQRRNIQFAQLPSVSSDYYVFAPMKQLSWQDGQRAVVCTLRIGDAKRLHDHGAKLNTIDRQARRFSGKEYPGVPIYCTQPY